MGWCDHKDWGQNKGVWFDLRSWRRALGRGDDVSQGFSKCLKWMSLVSQEHGQKGRWGETTSLLVLESKSPSLALSGAWCVGSESQLLSSLWKGYKDLMGTVTAQLLLVTLGSSVVYNYYEQWVSEDWNCELLLLESQLGSFYSLLHPLWSRSTGSNSKLFLTCFLLLVWIQNWTLPLMDIFRIAGTVIIHAGPIRRLRLTEREWHTWPRFEFCHLPIWWQKTERRVWRSSPVVVESLPSIHNPCV